VNIGLIVPGFSAGEDDWCIPALLNLVRRLAAEANVHVFPLRYPHQRPGYRVYGARVYPQGGAHARGPGRVALLGRAIAAVVRQHRRRPFDVLHAIWADEPGFVAVAAARLLGVPSLISVAGGELVGLPEIGYGGQLSRLNRWLVGRALGQGTAVTAGSAYLQRLTRAHVGGRRVLRMPIGVDTETFHPADVGGGRSSASEDVGGGQEDDVASKVASQVSSPRQRSLTLAGDPVLVNAGSLVPVKDHAALLRAMREVVNAVPGAHLHVLGGGPLRADLETLAASLHVRSSVTFHGAVSFEEMPAHYRAADLCVLSSLHEAQGLVILESAACGRATVGTGVGVLPELVPDWCVAPPADPAGLTEVLVAALRDEATPVALGASSRRAVEAAYTLDLTVESFLDLYRDLSM
jgi:glycosyltransferase involved in cell wall biosynthesis